MEKEFTLTRSKIKKYLIMVTLRIIGLKEKAN
jgi:hypothetical protein